MVKVFITIDKLIMVNISESVNKLSLLNYSKLIFRKHFCERPDTNYDFSKAMPNDSIFIRCASTLLRVY